MFQRQLALHLPKGQSTFLWGARQTGKSHYLQAHFSEAVWYDLLNTSEVARFTKTPHLLREEVMDLKTPQLIIIDEIQKVPELLNEVHWLIENSPHQFILCGSSAKKLKAEGVNLLGGRAWVYLFFPLVSAEIPELDLLKALQQGLIPNHYLAPTETLAHFLQAYVDVYLTEEIRNEGLVRNLTGFARFLDVVGMNNGEMINASNIARDCGVDRASVKGYFQILVDTYLGYYLDPYGKKIKRDIVSETPKFYLFDVGIANYLGGVFPTALKGTVAGNSFEHFIFMELKAYLGMNKIRKNIFYWRTKKGLEVDFIIGDGEYAIEVKISEQVYKEDLKGLVAFCEEHKPRLAYVVSQDSRPRKLQISEEQAIHILPWRQFLEKLWGNELF